LLREFVHDKTDLFSIISVHITADVGFGFAFNGCEGNRVKFGAPVWITL
jgi:hypothetical protein